MYAVVGIAGAVLMIVGVSVAGMGFAQAETKLVAADDAVTSEICVVYVICV